MRGDAGTSGHTPLRVKLNGTDLTTLGVLFTVGALARLFYLSRMGLPDADPWRHSQDDRVRAGLLGVVEQSDHS